MQEYSVNTLLAESLSVSRMVRYLVFAFDTPQRTFEGTVDLYRLIVRPAAPEAASISCKALRKWKLAGQKIGCILVLCIQSSSRSAAHV